MPPTAPDSRVHVVVGILRRRDGRLLMQRRLPGTPCAGQWEFPGGKVEAGESPRRALARELEEEIGIMAPSSRELVKLPFDYAHARVWLEVFVVDDFSGEVVGREGQQICWIAPDEIQHRDILGAVHPILDALAREEVRLN